MAEGVQPIGSRHLRRFVWLSSIHTPQSASSMGADRITHITASVRAETETEPPALFIAKSDIFNTLMNGEK